MDRLAVTAAISSARADASAYVTRANGAPPFAWWHAVQWRYKTGAISCEKVTPGLFAHTAEARPAIHNRRIIPYFAPYYFAAASPSSTGYPWSTQSVAKFVGIMSALTFVNPICRKVSSAGFTFGHIS